MRSKSEQATVCPPAVAKPISDALIAKHGIIQAADIARCVHEQVQAAINQQKRLHPAEWRDDAPSPQPSQLEPEPMKKVPSMPRIGG